MENNVTVDTTALEVDYREKARSMIVKQRESLDRVILKADWNIVVLRQGIDERISVMRSIIECASEFGLINYDSVQELTKELIEIRVYYDGVIERAAADVKKKSID